VRLDDPLRRFGNKEMPEIVLAMDGSKYSERIVRLACGLAKKLSYGIALIYFSKFPDLMEEYIGVQGTEPPAKAAPYAKAAEEVTSKLSENVKETGNPADKITILAVYRESDMIAIGLRGLHGIEKIRSLGSISRCVLEGAICPVVAVTKAHQDGR
jgi:nucleotide-binding universal stress UspA family protein